MVSSCGALLGLLVGLVLVIISIPICHLLGITSQWKLFLPLAAVYTCGGLAGVWSAELRKDLRLKILFFSTSFPQLATIPVSILLLNKGFGLWTFPIAALVGSVLQIAALIPAAIPIRFGWSRSLLPEIYQYTRGILGFSLVNYWARKLDDLLIGRFLGTAPLAVYSNAYRLMLLPITQVISLFSPLILPYMAKKQDDLNDCRNELYGFLSIIGLIVFGGMTVLWLERDILILWYLGPGWQEVSDILFWFAPLGMLQSLINPLGNCYMLSGKNDRFFWIGIVNTMVVILGFIIGLRFGVIGVAIGYFLANVVMIYPNVNMAISTIGGSFLEWIRKTGMLWFIPLGGIIFSRFNAVSNPLVSVILTAFVIGFISILVLTIQFRRSLPAAWRFVFHRAI